VDKFLYRVPGFASLLDLFHARPTPRSGCLDLLKEGRLLALSPGGTYEAQLGDSRYGLVWRGRAGFAAVLQEAGGVPVIPVFTQNLRQAYRVLNTGVTRPFWVWLYDKQRIPLVPIYGNFPVKLRTYIGQPVEYKPGDTAEQIATACREALESLIAQHQQPGTSTWQALLDRVK